MLALISNLYLRTAETHARSMLDACGQIAAGLGAPAQKPENKQDAKSKIPDGSVGNASLGLWVGEQFLGMPQTAYKPLRRLNFFFHIRTDIYKREGNEKKARKQELLNDRLADAVKELSKRHFTQAKPCID